MAACLIAAACSCTVAAKAASNSGCDASARTHAGRQPTRMVRACGSTRGGESACRAWAWASLDKGWNALAGSETPDSDPSSSSASAAFRASTQP